MTNQNNIRRLVSLFFLGALILVNFGWASPALADKVTTTGNSTTTGGSTAVVPNITSGPEKGTSTPVTTLTLKTAQIVSSHVYLEWAVPTGQSYSGFELLRTYDAQTTSTTATKDIIEPKFTKISDLPGNYYYTIDDKVDLNQANIAYRIQGDITGGQPQLSNYIYAKPVPTTTTTTTNNSDSNDGPSIWPEVLQTIASTIFSIGVLGGPNYNLDTPVSNMTDEQKNDALSRWAEYAKGSTDRQASYDTFKKALDNNSSDFKHALDEATSRIPREAYKDLFPANQQADALNAYDRRQAAAGNDQNSNNSSSTTSTDIGSAQDAFKLITGSDFMSTINPWGKSDLREVIGSIIYLFITLSGLIAVGFIVYGGYLYITSGGNPESAKKGLDAVKTAAIGLIVVLAAWLIVSLVLQVVTTGKITGL
jgi:hypothetical protein